MIAGDRYFMVIVDLLQARDRLDYIIESVRKHKLVPSQELMAATIEQIADAMVKTSREQFSDPNLRIVPNCQAAGCYESGDYHMCLNHSCDVEVR